MLLYLALGAVASSLLLISGVFRAAFLVFNIDTKMLLRPAIDRHSLSSLPPQGWRSSVDSESDDGPHWQARVFVWCAAGGDAYWYGRVRASVVFRSIAAWNHAVLDFVDYMAALSAPLTHAGLRVGCVSSGLVEQSPAETAPTLGH